MEEQTKELSLGEVFNLCHTDKAAKHQYDTVYEPFFEKVIDKSPVRILEIGTFRGESAAAFLHWFPNVQVTTVDTFQRIPVVNVEVLKDERVNFIKGDSQNPLTYEGLIGDFDFIIDDGLHTPEANRRTFEACNHLLGKNGVYFIEDVWPISIMSDEEMNHHWIKRHRDAYTKEKYCEFEKAIEYTRREDFDLRKRTGEPDSYIIALQYP